MENKDTEKWYENTILLTIIIIIFWLLILTFFYKWNYDFSFFEEISKNGFTIISANPANIGDTFNIFNSLIGAITIVLLFRTYKLQQRAFQKQSEELEATKEIFERQKEEMEEQKKIMKQQEKEMQEQNHQQYVKFLLEQKNEILKNLNFREQK